MEANTIQQAASTAAAQSRSFISEQLNDRATQLGTSISQTADDLRRIADSLRSDQGTSASASLAYRGADAIDRVGQYLRDADGERLMADAENFARQRPWAVALGAFATGFSLSRILKASSSRRYNTMYSSSNYAS